MFQQPDSQFLKEVGLESMPEEQKRPFLEHIFTELESRVGAALSEGLSPQQLDEFAAIIDRKDDVINSWLAKNQPNYLQDELYLRLQKAMNVEAGNSNLNAEYVATKWLTIVRPNYRDVVVKTTEALKQEIIANREKLLN